MRNSRILKLFSYIMLPIFVGILIISIFYIQVKDATYYDEEKYFESESFMSLYMTRLSDIARKLIYKNPEYKNIEDGDSYIFYSANGEFSYDAPRMYFLIIYNNKALTNVELTSDVSTIESIKNYIANVDGNKIFNIVNGKVETNSAILRKRAKQYQESFTYKYFTRNNVEVGPTDEFFQLETGSGDGVIVGKSTTSDLEYITAHIEDFQIYTSYTPKFAENSNQALSNEFIEILKPYQTVIYVLVPISTMMTILILLYLSISIGHKNGVEGISTTDFDKIPLEIILGIGVAIFAIIMLMTFGVTTPSDISLEVSLIVTAYFSIYIVIAIIFDTFVRRLKAKTFWKSTIIGKIFKQLGKIFSKLEKFFKELKGTSKFFDKTTKKFILDCVIAIVFAVMILLIFHEDLVFTAVLETVIVVIFIFRLLKAIADYDKIEEKLKEMYEGNNNDALERKEFLPEFYQSVDYINDISNGFERAIQDRIKSERLKTELITNVSHDIKTPLTSIINYVDLLKKEDIRNEKANEYIEILDSKSQRLKKLIEDLVEASKVSTGNVKLQIEKINIVELLNQAIGEFEDKFEAKKLEILLEAKESEIYILADSRYMYRIVENLFSNISKYALENSRVYIDIIKKSNEVYIEMKNISKEKLNISAEELMQRFVRGDKSRTTEGSGLGISIAQNLTEIQKGVFNLKLDGDLFRVELIFNIL